MSVVCFWFLYCECAWGMVSNKCIINKSVKALVTTQEPAPPASAMFIDVS